MHCFILLLFVAAFAGIHTLNSDELEVRVDTSAPRILEYIRKDSNGRSSLIGDSATLQRLKVDPEGRSLIRNDGTPFFWLGDTAWFIMRLTNDDIRYYLSNRVEKGFTGIQVDLNPYAWTNLMAPGECENPFLNDNIDTPNDSYWQRADWMVDEVARHGLYVLLTPMWGKHYPRYVRDDTAKAYELGKWLGSRYRDRTHVIMTTPFREMFS